MKAKIFPFFLILLTCFLLLSGCEAKTISQTQSIDPFQAFIEKWELYHLIPEGLYMTDENKDSFLQHFQQYDERTFPYVVMLLRGVSNGDITLLDEWSDPESGVYLNNTRFCLYDMNQDGVDELILKTGYAEADFMFTVFTIVDGDLTLCGQLSGSHASLYTNINGSGTLVRYAGHMGVYWIEQATLSGATLITQEIDHDTVDFANGEEYPLLEDYGYGDFDDMLLFEGYLTLLLAPAG